MTALSTVFPIGGGGMIIRMNMGPLGLAGGAACGTDTTGAYEWLPSKNRWFQVFADSTLPFATGVCMDSGCLDICNAPSNQNVSYMIMALPDGCHSSYGVFYSPDDGVHRWGSGKVWSAPTLQFESTWDVYPYAGVANDGDDRFANQRIAIDPNDPLVAYVGLSYGCFVIGPTANIGQDTGIFRTTDGGVTWTRMPFPMPTRRPGHSGMAIDFSSATTTLTGPASDTHTVCSHVVMPVSGVGVFESFDGGNTWTQTTSQPTPSTVATITTTNADSQIILAVWSMDEGASNPPTSSPALTWNSRNPAAQPCTYAQLLQEPHGTGQVYPQWGGMSPASTNAASTRYGVWQVWWANAPAGTYTVTVTHPDGQGSGAIRADTGQTADFVGTGYSQNVDTGANGGATLTITAVTSGSLAPGMSLNDGRYLTREHRIMSQVTPLLGGETMGGVGRYLLNSYVVYDSTVFAPTTTISGYNIKSYFAHWVCITGGNQANPFDTAAIGYNNIPNPAYSASMGGPVPALQTVAASATLIGFAFDAVSFSPDAGATQTISLDNLFYGQIGSSAVTPGTHSFPFGVFSVQGYISGTTLTVTLVNSGSGPILPNTFFHGSDNSGNSVPNFTTVVSQLTGTTGGVGTYQVQFPGTPVAVGSSGTPVSIYTYAPVMAVLDALVPASGKTIALQSGAGATGSAWSMATQGQSGTGPTIVTGGKFSATGTYWASVNGGSSGVQYWSGNGGQFWRKKIGGVWERIDGSYTASYNTGMMVGQVVTYQESGVAVVDPRAGHEGRVYWIGGHGAIAPAATTNGDAALNSISWFSDPGVSHAATVTSDVGWQNFGAIQNFNGGGVGDTQIDQTNGNIVMGAGYGIFNWSVYTPDGAATTDPTLFQATNIIDGVEQTLCDDICTPPGSPYVIAGVQDEMLILNTDISKYSTNWRWNGPSSNMDTNCFQLDWAGDDPNYVAGQFMGLGGNLTAVSSNGGGTWAVKNALTSGYAVINGTGCIAFVKSPSNVIAIQGSGVPQWTTDMLTWTSCTGLPILPSWLNGTVNYWTSRMLAAERDGSNICYAYAPYSDGTNPIGVYKSINGGQSFTYLSGSPAFGSTAIGGVKLFTIPGFPGHVWLAGQNFKVPSPGTSIWHSDNYGASGSWVQLSNSTANVMDFAVGAQASGASYPRLFKMGTDPVAGDGIHYSDDKGANWTLIGGYYTLPPAGSFYEPVAGIIGNYQNADLLFGTMSGFGAFTTSISGTWPPSGGGGGGPTNRGGKNLRRIFTR